MEEALQSRLAQLQAELNSLHKAISVLNQLAAELDIHTAMQNVRQVALELLDCERVTLFLIFERRRELRAMIDQSEILRIQFGEGIAGLVAQTGGSMNLPDVYEHPMFNKEVDRITGFRTRSMLCMAVSDMTGKNVAVMQALNKKSGQPFTPADERNLKLFGTHLGNTLVKAKLHETAKREKERLQAIYNCFKTLSTAEEVGQMVVCATAALERDIIHADRVFFFLVDKPRGELWLHTVPQQQQHSPAGGAPPQCLSMRLRIGQQGGVVGLCAETKKPKSWADFEDPSQDPALRRLAPHLAPARIKSVLVQPIHGTNNDRVLAVVLALNKREAEGTNDIFFEPFFTDADCDAMALFAYEVGDLLSERSLELSLLSALSVVGHDGAHPNAAHRQDAGSASGGGCSAGCSGSPHGPGSASGEEDLIRSQLIQMYLPEYKKEGSGTHAVFNRNSFSAANATANQMRASLERKRSALFFDGQGQGPAGNTAKRGFPRSRPLLVFGSGGGAWPGLTLSAAAATRSSAWLSGRGQLMSALGGGHDDGPCSAPGPGPASAATSEAPGSPALTSDLSGDMQLLPELGALRCASSSHAEHPAAAMGLRYGGGAGGRAERPHASLSVGTAPSASAAHAQAMLRLGRGGLRPQRARPVSGPVVPATTVAAAGGGAAGAGAAGGPSSRHCGQPNGVIPAFAAAAAAGLLRAGGDGGGSSGGGGSSQDSGLGRLVPPWRGHVMRRRAGAGAGEAAGPLGPDSDDSDGDGCEMGGGCDQGVVVRYLRRSRVDLEEAEEGAEGEFGDADAEELGEAELAADDTEAALAGAAEAAEVEGSGRASRQASGTTRHHSHPFMQHHQPPPLQLPLGDPATLAPFAQRVVHLDAELRAAAEGTLQSGLADPQALRSHLSCTNLAAAGSPRSPCFYARDQLRSWDWDFTEYNVEELIKLAYDIFIVSGAMEEFAVKPKVLRNFLTAVASHYHALPYHNFNHVCHVLHATFLIANTTHAVDVLKPLERLALLLAALCHDLDHDGHSNSYHINSGSELARIYNDQSVMENHHCAMTFAILSRTDCNVLAALAPEEQRAARKIIISAILCTDMANHFTLTQEFQKHSVVYDPESEADRMLLTKVLLHAADIGNAVRPFHVNHAMSRRVHREFESQAAEELRLGLPVTFSVDTADHVMCARVELNFLDYVVTALWERLVDVLPELGPQLAQLRVNRARYRRIADTGKTAAQVLAEESQQPMDTTADGLAVPSQSSGTAAAAAAASNPSTAVATPTAAPGPAPSPAEGAPPGQEAGSASPAVATTGAEPGPGAAAGGGGVIAAAAGGPRGPPVGGAQDMVVSPAGSPPQLPNGVADSPHGVADSVMSDAQA